MKEHVIYKKCIYRCIAVRHARRSVNCMVRKKRETEIVCSFHGISIICRLQVDFIFTQMRNNCCVSCLRNAIRPKTALSRDTWHVERAGISLLFAYLSFIAEIKSNKGTRYKQTNCTPKYVLDRRDICLDFEKFAVS